MPFSVIMLKHKDGKRDNNLPIKASIPGNLIIKQGGILEISEKGNKTVPYLFGYKAGFPLSRISPMNFCYNMSFTLPKQFQRSMSYKMDLDFWTVLKGKQFRLKTEEIWYSTDRISVFSKTA